MTVRTREIEGIKKTKSHAKVSLIVFKIEPYYKLKTKCSNVNIREHLRLIP